MSLTHSPLDDFFRENSGRAVAAIAKRFGDVELAEDVVQEAYVRLLQLTEHEPIPDNLNTVIAVVRLVQIGDPRSSRGVPEKLGTVILVQLELRPPRRQRHCKAAS
ncbi:MAG: hypothetical protein ACXVAO_18265, partial [Vulcanimicrobiaceae bacterium]